MTEDARPAEGQLLGFRFDQDDIATSRRAVTRCALAVGVIGERLDGFVLAVNEIVTNSVRHGAGHGRLRLGRTADTLWCEVDDQGRWVPSEVADAIGPPPTTATGGRGLWLARQLCDAVTIDRGATGTTVRLTLAIG